MKADPRSKSTKIVNPEIKQLPFDEFKENLNLISGAIVMLVNLINIPLNLDSAANGSVNWSLNALSVLLVLLSMYHEKLVHLVHPAAVMILIKMQV